MGSARSSAVIPGDAWQRAATVRAYYAFMWAHPGKKLLFMGQEFGQLEEWNFAGELDWFLLDDPLHAGLRHCVRDLNRLYRGLTALHARDCEAEGFQWIVVDDAKQSVVAWLRRGGALDPPVAVVMQFHARCHDSPIGLACLSPAGGGKS